MILACKKQDGEISSSASCGALVLRYARRWVERPKGFEEGSSELKLVVATDGGSEFARRADWEIYNKSLDISSYRIHLLNYRAVSKLANNIEI